MFASMKHALFFLGLALVVTTATNAQTAIIAGPMVGHVDMREALVWLQTTHAVPVYVEYADSSAPDKRFRTPTQTGIASNMYTLTFRLDSVEPGRTYTYTVVVDGKGIAPSYPTTIRTQPIWKWKKQDPPAATLAIGSCLYINEEGYERGSGGYGSDYEILTAIHTKRPHAMLWLGDNVYLREPDWNSRAGMYKRYAHTRAVRELQPLLASTAHYAIWDDHDFGPNDSDRGWWGKADALQVFKDFWPNPSYGVSDKPGITTSFSLIDVDVFMLDDRYYRAPNNRKDGDRTILGEHQIQWLIEALSSSTATFKIVAVGSQFLTDNLRKECFARMPEERQRIIDLITKNDIKGVLFVSGDIHAAELSKLERSGTYPLYEFTSSSLTAGANKDIEQQSNAYRVPGTAVGKHNFGLISVSGPAKQRVLTLSVHDINGNEIWQRTISETELR